MKRTITSLTHPIVKELVRLRESHRMREERGSVLIQGSKMIVEASASTQIQLLMVADASLIPKELSAAEVIVANPEILQKVSGVMSSEGIVAEVALPAQGVLSGLKRVLALDGVADPGNLGTVLRTALAFGWEGVFLLDNCCDPFNDKAVRAAMGATFRIPLRSGNSQELQRLAQENGWECLVADIQGKPVDAVTTSQKGVLLILGSEAHGPSEASRRLATAVTLPMSGSMESLNVSVAGAILLYLLKK